MENKIDKRKFNGGSRSNAGRKSKNYSEPVKVKALLLPTKLHDKYYNMAKNELSKIEVK